MSGNERSHIISDPPRKEDSLGFAATSSSSAPRPGNDGDGYYSATPSLYSVNRGSAQQPSEIVTSQPQGTMSLAQTQALTGSHVVPDDTFDNRTETDGDSAYGSESLIGGDTVTLASYITDYRYENGRRYHSYRDGAYWGPNDEHGTNMNVKWKWEC
jgi:hypothetical protein